MSSTLPANWPEFQKVYFVIFLYKIAHTNLSSEFMLFEINLILTLKKKIFLLFKNLNDLAGERKTEQKREREREGEREKLII